MVAINSALQIDLTGQVCSDSIGNQFYSGIGGQVDFLRGASRSRHGKPIIAISSTAKDGTISCIVPMLGKTIRQRAQALIDISHPKFREDLYQFCEKTKWLQRPLAAQTAVAR